MDSLSKHQEVNELLSLYKSLLTQKQQVMLSYYYEDDYSLSEIADILDISRNAVHDQITKAVEKMTHWEEHLGLNHQKQQRETLLGKLQKTDLNTEQTKLCEELKKVI